MISRLVDSGIVPDFALRIGIRSLLRQRLREEEQDTPELQQLRKLALIDQLRRSPIAINTKQANEQHYELPTAFFQAVLGRHLKYSSGFWEGPVAPGQEHLYLDSAEAAMLRLTCERAEVADGQRILDLGCGWGSLSLWLAERYPAAQVTGVSNSASQKRFIDREAQRRGLANLQIITADINHFDPAGRFDRILSIEMLEHVRNYDALMKRLASWLVPGGKLFVHIFTHRQFAYPFEVRDESDWMARHFFTGGMMPSADLLPHFAGSLLVEEQWAVPGTHYARTCRAWLQRMDRSRPTLMPLFRATYGEAAARWWVYWRLFFMACEELFDYADGDEWFVSHYRFVRPAGGGAL